MCIGLNEEIAIDIVETIAFGVRGCWIRIFLVENIDEVCCIKEGLKGGVGRRRVSI